MILTLRTFFIGFTFFSLAAFPIDLRFESGLPKAVSFEAGDSPLEEGEAVEKVLEQEFRQLRGVDWKLTKRQEDTSHVHLTFDLFFQDHPVFFQHLKIHYNKAGFVDYLTNTVMSPFEVPVLPTRNSWEEQKETVLSVLFGRSPFLGSSKARLGIWLDEKHEKAGWAFEVQAVPKGPEMLKRAVVSVEDTQVLDERQVMRHWAEPLEEKAAVQLQIFDPYPATAGLAGGHNSTVSETTQSAGTLKNDYVYVRFDSSDDGRHFDVSDTNALSFDINPTNYQRNCSGSDQTCPNQRIDSGNVYYHLTKYRGWLANRASSLGTSLAFPYDPLPVFVNFMTKLIQKKCPKSTLSLTKSEQTNNAAYIGGPCDDSGTIDHCLVFLRYGNDSPCYAAGTDPGGSFARESLIVAHEYQHYVTDMISGIEFGSVNQIRVGDAIHEGYSDYFGASYSQVSLVGKYAFRVGFSSLERDLTNKSVQYDQSTTYTSPHQPGWVWASALWELRDTLGSSTVDLLALKSLYYLSTTPGFIDSVEALVQADKNLNGGANERKIRTLFFDERKFLGSLTNAFQDEDKKIVKLGFQGCASVESRSAGSSFPVFSVFALWLLSTCWVGRRLWRKL